MSFKHSYFWNNDPVNAATFAQYVNEADKMNIEYFEVISNLDGEPYFIHHGFDCNNPIYKQIKSLLRYE